MSDSNKTNKETLKKWNPKTNWEYTKQLTSSQPLNQMSSGYLPRC